jgi:hypothetical protein
VLLLAVPDAWAGQGWYLLTPPPLKGSKDRRDFQAPLRMWSQFGAYDTARECEESLSNWRGSTEQQIESVKNKADIDRLRDRLTRADESRCIASDDPRLK